MILFFFQIVRIFLFDKSIIKFSTSIELIYLTIFHSHSWFIMCLSFHILCLFTIKEKTRHQYCLEWLHFVYVLYFFRSQTKTYHSEVLRNHVETCLFFKTKIRTTQTHYFFLFPCLGVVRLYIAYMLSKREQQ